MEDRIAPKTEPDTEFIKENRQKEIFRIGH